jgi:hypothetical protein
MSRVHLHGYALLPFVVVAGICLYVAFGAFVCMFVPPKLAAGEAIGDLLSYLIFEAIWSHWK